MSTLEGFLTYQKMKKSLNLKPPVIKTEVPPPINSSSNFSTYLYFLMRK